MARNMRKPLVVTQGDPAGIGPEITVKSWFKLRASRTHTFAAIAVPDNLARSLDRMNGPDLKIINDLSEVANTFPHALPVLALDGQRAKPGQPDTQHAASITQSVEQAVNLCASGEAAGMITNPISKDILYSAGFKHPGHTEYLGALTQDMDMPDGSIRGPVMMLSGGGLRVGLATIHMPLKQAASALNADRIMYVARVMNAALKRDFGIPNPRIALAGLNPHAGENGTLGQEEIDIINPAAKALRDEGIHITDAQSADTLFHLEARKEYDAVLTMYHDQGLIPVKTLDFHGGVNITIGLPVVRTSPDHGTAFGIAGQGIARAESLISAIEAARIVADNRTQFQYG